jgi:hypothetical protein
MWDALVGVITHLFSLSNPLWFYYPLCAVVAVVYKATKLDDPRQIAWASLHFFLSVTAGMVGLAIVFYILSVVF